MIAAFWRSSVVMPPRKSSTILLPPIELLYRWFQLTKPTAPGASVQYLGTKAMAAGFLRSFRVSNASLLPAFFSEVGDRLEEQRQPGRDPAIVLLDGKALSRAKGNPVAGSG
ncbi:MAG: hypothetical protein U0Y68_20770 [Blastocatellia bacterium]